MKSHNRAILPGQTWEPPHWSLELGTEDFIWQNGVLPVPLPSHLVPPPVLPILGPSLTTKTFTATWSSYHSPGGVHPALDSATTGAGPALALTLLWMSHTCFMARLWQNVHLGTCGHGPCLFFYSLTVFTAVSTIQDVFTIQSYAYLFRSKHHCDQWGLFPKIMYSTAALDQQY